MKDWIRQALTAEQQLPLKNETDNAAILASAGSGKTRTLVYALVNEIAEGTPPSDIIAFTFTEKAADELLARVHGIVKKHLSSVDLSGLYIGTIHGWCLQYLMEQSHYYNFSPIDELHLDALISRLYDALKLEEIYGLGYPRAVPNPASPLIQLDRR